MAVFSTLSAGLQPFKRLRPPIELRHRTSKTVEFAVTDVAYRMYNDFPVVYYYGDTAEGHSVCARVWGLLPYCYIKPREEWSRTFYSTLVERLEAGLRTMVQGTPDEKEADKVMIFDRLVVEQKQRFVGCEDLEPCDWWKIQVRKPSFIRLVRLLLAYPNGGRTADYEDDKELVIPNWWPETFPKETPLCPVAEASLPFVYRSMVDCGIKGVDYALAGDESGENVGEAKQMRHVPREQRVSKCDLEVSVHHSLFRGSPHTRLSDKPPELVITGYDIETLTGENGEFPDPRRQPIQSIAAHTTYKGQAMQCCHMVGSIEVPPDADPNPSGMDIQYYCYETERDMLIGWFRYVAVTDPDIINGYNQQRFDSWYVAERARILRLPDDLRVMGRRLDQPLRVKEKVFRSRARQTVQGEVAQEGRVDEDVLQLVLKMLKMRSYTLEYMSRTFLDMGKVHFPYERINPYSRTPTGRAELARYNVTDTWCSMLLREKLKLGSAVQQAGVMCVTLNDFLYGGQSRKIMAKTLHAFRDKGLKYTLETQPPYRVLDEIKYQGATVVDMKRGYYKNPVVVLDFASLYPSIMMALGLCPSTFVTEEQIARYGLVEGEHYTRPMAPKFQHAFLLPTVRKALFPELLRELKAERKKMKKERDKYEETDPHMYSVFDAIQVAIKEVMNSKYGTCGFTKSQFFCWQVAEMVTAKGREMLETLINWVQNKYTRANGYCFDAEVVYGDTDSIFVHLKHWPESKDIQDAVDIGLDMAQCSKSLFEPDKRPEDRSISLEFEKVFLPVLLVNRKRYSGMKYTLLPGKTDNGKHRLSAKHSSSGLDNVRRDSCALVGKTIDEVLRIALKEGDIPGSVEYFHNVCQEMLSGRIPLSDLIISKALSRPLAEYKTDAPHLVLTRKLMKRNAATAPRMGERVPYLILRDMSKPLAKDRAEDPKVVKKDNLPIDYGYYLKNQMTKPFLRIFYWLLQDKAIRQRCKNYSPLTEEEWLRKGGHIKASELETWLHKGDSHGDGFEDGDTTFNAALAQASMQEPQSSSSSSSAANEEIDEDEGSEDSDGSRKRPAKPAPQPVFKKRKIKHKTAGNAAGNHDIVAMFGGNASSFSAPAEREYNSQQQLDMMMNTPQARLVFDKLRMVVRQKTPAIRNTSMANQVVIHRSCFVCKAKTATLDDAVCDACRLGNQDAVSAAYLSLIKQKDGLAHMHTACWDKCRKCVKGIDPTDCTDMTCHTWWERDSSKDRLESVQADADLTW